MRGRYLRLLAHGLALGLTLGLSACATTDSKETGCPDTGAVVQVLGSGGPIPDLGRASSGYLVSIDGAARVLIDAGGGTFASFSRTGARFEDLEFVGLSHFHADHSAEFPAFLKGAYFSERTEPLAVAGPAGSSMFPGLEDYLSALFEPGRGAYHYLSGFLTGDAAFVLDPFQVDHTTARAMLVYQSDRLKVSALGVPHGIVPALAYRVDTGDASIVFASDQNGSSEAFVEFARGADLLVMHLAVPESASGTAIKLHARPSRIGAIANNADAQMLLISHFMARSLADLEGNLGEVKKAFSGEIVQASDLLCVAVPARD